MTLRILLFVIVEMGLLFLAMSGVTLLWRSTQTLTWENILLLIEQASAPTLCFFVSFYWNDLYNVRAIKSLGEFYRYFSRALLTTVILLFLFSPLVSPPPLTSSVPFSSLLLVLIGASVVLPLRWSFYTFGNLNPFAERILILGTGDFAWKVATAVRVLSPLGYVIAGFIDDRDPQSQSFPSQTPLPSPILGPLDRLEEIIEQFSPNRIIVALRERRGRMPLQTLLRAHWERGIVVEDGIKVHEQFSGKLAIENLTPSFLIFSTDFKKSQLDMALRRALSLVTAIVGLILFAPLLGLISLAIKLDSEGSVFFLQDRAGWNGKTFRLVKFRTMHSASPRGVQESVWSRDLDSRVTRVGRWLRKTHLDELPQFFNILRGDMDLVGPRPEMTNNIKTMEAQIPYYTLRMTVRPGVTGWAQIKSGYAVSQEDVTEKIRYDLYYIKNRSLWFDLKIILDTANIMLLGKDYTVSDRPITQETSLPLNLGKQESLSSPVEGNSVKSFEASKVS
jgi:exopolysaccharide biosynthesis polyprenyl glycosylphosphotransferase